MKPKTITVFAQLCNMLPREPLIRISQDQTPSVLGELLKYPQNEPTP